MKHLCATLCIALAAAFFAQLAWAAYDDINVEDNTVIERRAEMQREYAESKARTKRERKTLPDEIVQVVEASRLNISGATDEYEEYDDNPATVQVASLGYPSSSDSSAPPRVRAAAVVETPRNGSLMVQIAGVLAIIAAVYMVARFMPKDEK